MKKEQTVICDNTSDEFPPIMIPMRPVLGLGYEIFVMNQWVLIGKPIIKGKKIIGWMND
jgi:hypothetical protein